MSFRTRVAEVVTGISTVQVNRSVPAAISGKERIGAAEMSVPGTIDKKLIGGLMGEDTSDKVTRRSIKGKV